MENTSKLPFTFYTDPGHGWLRVPKTYLEKEGISKASFTSCSYENGKYVYLEEDCDFTRFVKILVDKGIIRSYQDLYPRIGESHTDSSSSIRDLSPLNCNTVEA